MVFETTFNNLADTWTNNSITLTSNGALPAKDRGYYFNGTGTTHMKFDTDFALGLDFTVSAWINSGSATERVIFSKDDNATSPPNTIFVFKLKSDHTLAAEITVPGNPSSRETKNPTTSITNDQWQFVAAGLQINDDANTAEVKIYQTNDTASLETTSAGYYFIDDATAFKSYVGASRITDQSTFTELYNGFMYGVWVENVY